MRIPNVPSLDSAHATGATASPLPRRAERPEEYDEIFRLRYDVYLAEQRQDYPEADHAHRRLILDGDFDGHTDLFFLSDDQGATATARVRVWGPDQAPGDLVKCYSLTILPHIEECRIAEISALIIRRDVRGRGAMLTVVGRALERAFDEKRAELLVCCASVHLLPFYRRLGLRPFGASLIETSAGPITPLMWVATDATTPREAGSPFARLTDRIASGYAQHSAKLSRYLELQKAVVADQRARERATAA